MSEWTQESVLRVSRGFMECRVLMTAVELDLFSLLESEALIASEIAARRGSNLRALTIVLDALSAMALLIKENERYRCAANVARLLSSSSPQSMLPMVLHNTNMWQRWSGLTEMVGGAVLAQGPDEMRQAFIGAMHTIGSSLAPDIVEKAQAGNSRRLLDVGGASGTYTLAFLAAHPGMKATLFDMAPVIEMARERIGQAGMLDRVELIPGDFHHDALPGGHDLAWVSAIIHSSDPAQIVDLLRNVHQSLEPGGRVIIRDHILSPDRTHPLGGALFAVNMLTGTGGNSYTYAEIESYLAAAGFQQIRLLHPDTNMDGMVDAIREH